MGKVAIIFSNYQKGIINQALLKLSIDNEQEVFSDYLKAILESSEIQNTYFSNQSGLAIKNVVFVSELKKIEIFLLFKNLKSTYFRELLFINEIFSKTKIFINCVILLIN